VLKSLKKFSEAITQYEKSVILLVEYSSGVMLSLQSVHCIVCCRIELRKTAILSSSPRRIVFSEFIFLGDFLGALDALTLGINIATKERGTFIIIIIVVVVIWHLNPALHKGKKQPIFGNQSSDFLRQTILDYEMNRILLMLLAVRQAPLLVLSSPVLIVEFPFSNLTTARLRPSFTESALSLSPRRGPTLPPSSERSRRLLRLLSIWTTTPRCWSSP